MSVTAARRAFLAAQYRAAATAPDSGIRAAHPLAPQYVEPSLMLNESDAAAEATRRQTIRGTQRRWLQIVVTMSDDANLGVDLGDVISLTHPRFGLSGGVSFRVMGIQPDAQNDQITFVLWG